MVLSKLLNKALWFLHKENKVNFIATFIVNFIFLPIKAALKFPILIYGPCRLKNLSGQIEFEKTIKKGMLKIGISDPVRSWNSKSFISITGKLMVGTNVVLRRGVNLSIASNATLKLDSNVYIGDNNTIICKKDIWIKEAVRIGNNTTIMDSDFHYVVNVVSREIKPADSPIVIGENSWIGGWCTIKKGTQIPKGTIVAGPHSMLGKNYIGKIPEFSLIAGSPAKLLVEGVRRVNNKYSENELIKHFAKTSSNYVLPDNVDLDEFCMP